MFRIGHAPLRTIAFATLGIAAAAGAHPGHGGGLPHPFHHVDPLLGTFAVAVIAAAIAWRSARRSSRAWPLLDATSAAVAAAGAWLLLA